MGMCSHREKSYERGRARMTQSHPTKRAVFAFVRLRSRVNPSGAQCLHLGETKFPNSEWEGISVGSWLGAGAHESRTSTERHGIERRACLCRAGSAVRCGFALLAKFRRSRQTRGMVSETLERCMATYVLNCLMLPETKKSSRVSLSYSVMSFTLTINMKSKSPVT